MARKSYGFYTEGNTAKKIDYETIRRTGNTSKNGKNAYVRGNAAPARKYEEVPQRRRKKAPQISKRQMREIEKESSRARYRRMQSESMGLGYVIFLSMLVVVTVLLSVTYLNCQAEILAAKSSINALKSNVEVQSSQNDAVAYDIEAYIDINRIIDVATNELGMVMANEEQIKYFEKHVDEFMNQYADVPEE